MMLRNSTRMTEIANPGSTLRCRREVCRKEIPFLDIHFLDLLWDHVYCYQCGVCLRYARKKALERGEPIERASL